MRIFKVMPSGPGHENNHMWLLAVVEPDGTEVTLETYATMAEAEAAKTALQLEETEDPA